MDPVEIKRYIDNLQGGDISENNKDKSKDADEEEFTNVNTKTRGQTAVNHEGIHLEEDP